MSRLAGEYSLGSVCPGKNLILAADAKGTINHVGIKLFDRRIIADYPSPVYLFVERYLLWVLLMKDESSIKGTFERRPGTISTWNETE